MSNISSDALAQIPKKISLHSQLPNFRDIPPNQKTILFISKLRQCNKLVRVDDQDLRKLKHLVLYQLLEYINICSNQFPIEAIPDFFNTVSINIFRQAQKPQAEEEDTYDPDEDEPTVDPAWYHLQFVYEMLLRFVYSAQSQNPEYQKMVKKYIDCDFIIRLIQLFNQSDPRERDYVKTILHRIYANIMSLRAYIRLTLKSELQTFYSGKQQHSGICDILEVLGSIINGYAVPLKAEHLQFLQQCLLPLHRVQHVKQILPQLSYCVSKFLEKDPKLSSYIIQQILLYYPRLNSHKEVTVLTELEELLELVMPDSLLVGKDEKLWQQQLKNPLAVYTLLFKTVAQAICSLHFQVSERAISMLSNQKFLMHVQAAYRKWAELYGQFTSQFSAGGLGAIVEEEDGFSGAGGTFGQQETAAIPVELPGIAGQQQGFQAAALASRNNPVILLAMSLRANQQGHWNSNIRINSEQALKQLSTVSSSDIQQIDQKMLNELVYSEVVRQIREATGQDVTQQAMGNVGKFGDYFKTYNVKERTTHYLPGYESEVIAPGKVMAAVVPEDPLFCRAEEMALKGFGLTPETVIGAIDGIMLEIGGQQPNPKIDAMTELTPCDKLIQKGFSLQDDGLRNRIMQGAADTLAASGILSVERPELPSTKLITVQSALPPPRIMSRRPSAGVPSSLGIRRKSVTPLTAQQAMAKKELKNFEKHSVNDARK